MRPRLGMFIHLYPDLVEDPRCHQHCFVLDATVFLSVEGPGGRFPI